MIEALSSNLSSATTSRGLAPDNLDVQAFQNLLNQANTNPNPIKSFVESAEVKFQSSSQAIDTKLRRFDSEFKVSDLVDAMHTSALRAVSMQLSSKISTKVSEGFEGLIKQQ